jgi:hypothetical protein
MNWSAEQLRLLRALGHEPMRLATPADFQPAPVGAAFSRDPGVPGEEKPSRQNAAPTGLLLAALSRAAGGRDLGALALDLERLRREPALKRALWPRLRALRREH